MDDELLCEDCLWYDHENGQCQYIQCNGLPDECTEPLPCEGE